MAIAVNRSGSSHATMLRAGEFCINLLDPDHFAHITPFASAAGREGVQAFLDKREPAWRA